MRQKLEAEFLPVVLDTKMFVHGHEIAVVASGKSTHRYVDPSLFSIVGLGIEIDRCRVQ